MTESFTAGAPGALAKSAATRRRVLVTGAAGNIGAYFAQHSHEQYDLRLMVHQIDQKAEALRAFGEVVTGELGDLAQLKALCRDVDTVLHLAGDPDPGAAWQSLLESNIVGAYYAFVAARQEGSIGMLDAFVSQRDLTQLIQRCIDVENIKFAILHGLSDNRFKRLDISDARALVGYEPRDDLTDENPRLKQLRLGERVSAHSLADRKLQSGIREEL